jgi:hypothetical protein
MNNNFNIIHNKPSEKKNAYFLSHNGLGDNITNIGAVNFLLNYYDKIYFLCKDIYEENVKLFFLNKNVVTVPFNSKNEYNECKKIITSVNMELYDCFVSGFIHKEYLNSYVTHHKLLQYEKKNEKYSIKYDHIKDFYNDIGLDSSIYVDYFHMESNEISKKYYEDIKNYNIVFLHTKGSNRSIQLVDIINLYKNKDEYLLICANENSYDENHSKYSIAKKYVNIPLAYYIDIIENSKYIHVIDSCFSCIIYPLILSNKINPIECVIYDL